jgi:hypothetical protein
MVLMEKTYMMVVEQVQPDLVQLPEVLQVAQVEAVHILTHLVSQVVRVHLLVTQLTLLFNILTLFVQARTKD